MGAAWFVARADTRGRWAGAVMLIVLIAVAGGGVLASAAGARRTASALTRFEDQSDAATLEFTVGSPIAAQIREFRALPAVEEIGRIRQLAIFNLDVGFLPTGGPVDRAMGHKIDRGRIVAGRRAHAADELNIGEGLAQRLHLAVGDQLTFQAYTPADVAADATGFNPTGPDMTFRIVGFVRRPLDLGARGSTGGVIIPTRAFAREHVDDVGSFIGEVLRVRTRHGTADAARVTAAARRIFGGDPNFAVEGLGIEGEGAASAISLTARGLWAIAAVAAVASVIALGLSFSRRMVDEAQDDRTLRALGLDRRQRWAALTIPVVPISIAGAVGAVVTAYLLSPIFPVGVARDAEPAPGLRVDGLVAALGFVAVAVAVLVVGSATAAVVTVRRERAASGPARSAAALAELGAPAPVSVGVGFALGGVRGRAVPKWSAIVTVTLGVLAVVVAGTFRSSLDRLAASPARYGWTWGVVLDGYGGGSSCPTDEPIAQDRSLSAVAAFCYADISIAGRPTQGSALRQIKGSTKPAIVSGRAPRTAREVAVGRDALDAAGRGVGDVITVRAGDEARRYTVVGTVLVPGVGDAEPLSGGAFFTVPGLQRVTAIDDNYIVVGLSDGVDQEAVLTRLTRQSGGLEPLRPSIPAEIERIRQIESLPVLLAGITVAIALVSVAYTLVVSVRRRRRDLAILKTVGFTRGQVRGTILVQATTFATVAVLVGGVLGLIVGNQVWRIVAEELGVSTSAAQPVAVLVLLVPVVVVVVDLIAAVPAWAAARTASATALRSE